VAERDASLPINPEPFAEETPAEAGQNRDRRHRRGRVIRWAVAGLLLVVVALLALPVFSTLQPGYYRRYPGLGKRMDNWATSTHSRMSCVDCHVEPGVGGFLSFAARSVPAFYSQLFEGANSTNLLSAPSRRACQKCHTTYRTVAPSGDLLIPHRAHVVVLKMDCVDCHKNLVHSPNRRGFNRPEMETCVSTCHDGVKATNQCVKCHTRKQTPASHKRKDWAQIHGQAAETEDCGRCHDWSPNNFCADCHKKRPASHAGNWKTDHGSHAKTRGKGCLVCHTEEFCKKCH
jgi:hypothetical protein